MTSPTQCLARSLACYVMNVHGRTPRRVQVVIDFGEDHSESLTIPAQYLAAVGPRNSDHREISLGSTELAILEVIGALDVGQWLGGEEVSHRAGYSYSGRFKEKPSLLVKLGKIRSAREGYSRADG